MDLIQDSHIAFVNLEHRADRLAHMNEQLSRVGLNAIRVRGLLPSEYAGDPSKVEVMRKRTPGAIGCHMSQVSIMREALRQNKHAIVFEDDIVFCDDFHERMDYIGRFVQGRSWDVIWLGAAFHVNPPHWHKKGESNMRPNCSAQLGYDAQRTNDPRMIRTFGAYNTFAYMVNKDSLENILYLLDENLHTSIGIDWLFIKLQPRLECFSFVPGCIYQKDNMSDIGNGMTVWSGHLKNGPYVFQKKMNDFDPDKFDWNECKI